MLYKDGHIRILFMTEILASRWFQQISYELGADIAVVQRFASYYLRLLRFRRINRQEQQFISTRHKVLWQKCKMKLP